MMKYDQVASTYSLRTERQRKFNFDKPAQRKKKIQKLRDKPTSRLQRELPFGSCSSTELGESLETEHKSCNTTTNECMGPVLPVPSDFRSVEAPAMQFDMFAEYRKWE